MPKAPLIVFVHTPKAAGSTVNEALSRAGSGIAHIEALVDQQADFLAAARRCDWISGHIPIDKFQAYLRTLDRPVRFFTCIREPRAQVVSHFNWLIEIYHRGSAFYQTHPANMQDISAELRSSDLGDPSIVAALLNKYHELFLNCQSLYLLGRRRRHRPKNFSGQAKIFEYIGTYDDLNTLLNCMIPGLKAGPIANASSYHFDKDVFLADEVKELLIYQNKADRVIYRHVTQNMPRLPTLV